MSDDAVDFHDLLIRVRFCEIKLSHYSCPVTLTAAPIGGRDTFSTLTNHLNTFKDSKMYNHFHINGDISNMVKDNDQKNVHSYSTSGIWFFVFLIWHIQLLLSVCISDILQQLQMLLIAPHMRYVICALTQQSSGRQ